MTFNFRSGSRAVGALGSVAALALVTGCGSGSSQVRIENHCDVPIQATFTNLLAGWSEADARTKLKYEVDADGALDVAAGASSTLVLGPPPSPKTRVNGQAFVTIRGDRGEWIMVAPMGEEAPPGSDVGYIKNGVFVVDGVLCSQVSG
ncbi:hypothetical protein [Demequina lutea]|uniref:Lipoprotein n=1 Tax=Demequina lutea TaxID=431489 RepID=A0A7Y9ZDN9_9MICO|nr:hypothetical protein [Demequina lutea]NYI42070.1 hypothetical protein [Demequina lutea]